MAYKVKYIWPHKYKIFGVGISSTNYSDMMDLVIQAAHDKRASCVSHLAVHGLVEAIKDEKFKFMLNKFEIVAPDGQPVRYALKYLYKVNLADRCYGPEFMLRVCRRAEI